MILVDFYVKTRFQKSNKYEFLEFADVIISNTTIGLKFNPKDLFQNYSLNY